MALFSPPPFAFPPKNLFLSIQTFFWRPVYPDTVSLIFSTDQTTNAKQVFKEPKHLMSEDQKRQLESQLWGIANLLRGKISADDYRDYILALSFTNTCPNDNTTTPTHYSKGKLWRIIRN